MEVILALAILTGAMAVLGEVARHTARNATADRVLTRAQMLCESKLAEMVAGLTAPVPAQDTLADDDQEPGDPGWQYAVEVDPVDSQGLVAVRVTVRQGLPEEKHPLEFSLVRWMTTPDALANLSNSNNSNNTGNTNSNTSNTNSSSSSPTPPSAASSGKTGGS
jgi:hypothetical protein